jgi:hypothetical protein
MEASMFRSDFPRVTIWRWLVFLLAWLVLGSGCASPISIAASTHPIPADQTMTVLGPAEGSAWSGNILFFPFFSFGPISPIKTARDDAIEEANADALIGVTVDHRTWFFLIFWINHTKIEGEAVRFTD